MSLAYQHPELYIYLSTLFLSLYYTYLKKFKGHMMILYFWLHAFSYLAFALLFLFREDLIPDSMKQLAKDTSYNNFPLYLIYAASLVGTYIILDKLVKKYPIPTILALSQISIVFSTIGYLLLGDIMSTISLIGIFILFIGAMISGLQRFSWKHPLKSFKVYDTNLLQLSTLKALLCTSTLLITFICVAKYNDTTRTILMTLTKHIHIIPFVAITPIHFNIGVQFANFLLMFLFITYALKEKNLILKTIFQEYRILLPLAAFYILNAFFFYDAFDLIENKNFVTAISKMYLPMTLFLSYAVYHEKPSREQVVGMCIIILGGFITVFG